MGHGSFRDKLRAGAFREPATLGYSEMAMSLPVDDIGRVVGSRLGDPLAGDYLVEGPVADSANGRVFRLTAGTDRIRLAAKICTGPADARRQFAALTAAAAVLNRTSGAGTRVPAPVALVEEHGLLVMEWIDGRSFAGLLRSPWQPPALALDGAARAGTWLAGYHAVSPGTAAPFDYAQGLAMLEALLAPLEGDPPAFTVGRHWLAQLERMAERNGSVSLPIRLHHGDFKPGNVLLTADAVYGIDIHSEYQSSVAEDLAYFIVDMELACFHPRGLRLLRHREALTRRVVDGYGVERWPGLAALVGWLRLHKIARNWVTFHTGRLHGMQRRYAAACLRWMARRSPIDCPAHGSR